MKLRELKLSEGLVDATILSIITSIVNSGITNMAQTVAIAKCLMMIKDGQLAIALNFYGYYDVFFPDKALIDSLKALSKEETQQLATFVLSILEMKDVQLASLVQQTSSVSDFLYYATAASANE